MEGGIGRGTVAGDGDEVWREGAGGGHHVGDSHQEANETDRQAQRIIKVCILKRRTQMN